MAAEPENERRATVKDAPGGCPAPSTPGASEAEASALLQQLQAASPRTQRGLLADALANREVSVSSPDVSDGPVPLSGVIPLPAPHLPAFLPPLMPPLMPPFVPPNPDEIAMEQMQPTWQPRSAATASEFAFASAAPNREVRLTDLFVKLAHSNILVDRLYIGTRWEHRINAFAGFGRDAVPAVRTLRGVTINWHMSTDGRLRLDGNAERVRTLAPDMQRAFPEYRQGATEHSQNTGRTANQVTSAAGRLNAEQVARRERERRIAGQVLVVPFGVLFDRNGFAGMWDILNAAIGVRNITHVSAMPWICFLRNMAAVTVTAGGRLKVGSATSSIEEVERVEAILQTACGAMWVMLGDAPTAPESGFQYGQKSEQVRVRESEPLFQ